MFAAIGAPERAEDWIRRALAIDPNEPIIQYNAACTWIALHREGDALDCLEASMGQGGLAREWITNDPDLDPVRDHPRFQEMLARLR